MPSRPPPPKPYETWLDYLLNPHRNGYETCVGYAYAELAELRADYASSHAIVVRQGDLLAGVANALRGDPEPLHLHSHHDLPELAAELRADDETLKLQNAVLRAEIERLKAESRTCLVCGVIMHEPKPDPADEYLRTAKAAIGAAKGTGTTTNHEENT